MTISNTTNEERGYLLPNYIITQLKEKNNELVIEERPVYVTYGVSYPIILNILDGIVSRVPVDKIPIVYIDEDHSKENVYSLLLSLNSSDSVSEKLGILVFNISSLNMQQARALLADVGIKWIPFTVNELLEIEFISRAISSALYSSSDDLFSVHNFSHLDNQIQKIMRKINALFKYQFWEEVLLNIRKLLENLIHLWWKLEVDSNDTELRDDQGRPLSMKKRLNLVRQKGGLRQNDVNELLSIKIIGDYCAHSKSFKATKPEVLGSIALIKEIINKMFPQD